MLEKNKIILVIKSHKNYLMLFVALFIAAITISLIFNSKVKDNKNPYNTTNYSEGTDKRISEAIDRLNNNISSAELVSKINTCNKKIELVFEGLPDINVAERILDCLDEYGMKATFFVTGIQAAENQELVKNIINKGHTIGNYSLNADKNMQNMSKENIIENLAVTQSILFNTTGMEADSLRLNTSAITDDIQKIAAALNINKVVSTNYVLDINSFKSYEDTLNYINRLKKGDIISIKLNELIDTSEYYNSKNTDINKNTELVNETVHLDSSRQEQICDIVNWIAIALQNTNYKPIYDELKIVNNDQKANILSEINTIDRAVSFMFTDLGQNNGESLYKITDILNKNNGKGTFFLTYDEISNNYDLVNNLINAGHEIGISVRMNSDSDYYDACYQLDMAITELKNKFYYDPKVVNQPWGTINEEMLEAVAAYSLKYVKQDTVIKMNDVNESSYSQIIADTFSQNVIALKRGQSVLCRMNYLKDSNVIAEAVSEIINTKTTYQLKTISQIIENESFLYNYPVRDTDMLADVKDAIFSGHLNSSEDKFLDMLSNNYIGNVFVNSSDKLPGFTVQEIEQIDTTGKINNNDNAVFLTFDDWGSDIAIDNILQVLKKHNVKATFFIRTNYVQHNPNLLRAIAMDGHDIASHTHEHLTLSDYDEGSRSYLSLTDAEMSVLENDLIKSYDVLQSIVGDVSYNGSTVLKKYFRPPTLAVSRNGIKLAFDLGFTSIIEGSFSTQDYAAESVSELTNKLFNGMYSQNGYLLQKIESGSIVVMHMSDESKYTAEALDIYLTANEKKSDNDSTKFVFTKISDYID